MANSKKSVLGKGLFPSPLATPEVKAKKEYGIEYARAIEGQWNIGNTSSSFYSSRADEFEKNRDFGSGKQSTESYKQILSARDNNDNDGTLFNINWEIVPIIPKFVNIIVNKTLDRNPRPNLEAVDPISLTEKDKKKAEIRAKIKNREFLIKAAQSGIETGIDIDSLPETTEEAEILMETTVKTDAEIAAQMASRMTLAWNEFNEKILRRIVRDFVEVGMGVGMRYNDPSYGIVEKYVDPTRFVHSYTEDPTFSDMYYAGHVEQISIGELRRIAGDSFTEKEYEEIASSAKNTNNNDPSRLNQRTVNAFTGQHMNGFDEYVIDVLHFQFKTTEAQYFEEKENQFGNSHIFYKGNEYNAPKNSVFERKPYKIESEVTYSGVKIVGIDKMFGYGKDFNMPRNLHDISRTNMRYHPVATEIRNMMPSSVVSKIRPFADMIQITHLKWQSELARAKSDGLAIDI